MRTIQNMLTALGKIDIHQMCLDAMVQTSDEFVKLQREQMYDGIKSDDTPMNRLGEFYQGYAPKTKAIKAAKGQKYDNVTLKDTGDFYSGINAIPDSDGLMVESTDSKSAMLQEDYGTEIFGLGKDKRGKWLADLQPTFFNNLELAINQGSGKSVAA